jgi:hypothetical protein
MQLDIYKLKNIFFERLGKEFLLDHVCAGLMNHPGNMQLLRLIGTM